MSWATTYIKKLASGSTVKFRPKGDSMKGKIESGQLVTVKPCDIDELSKGDIVLCRVGNDQYLHFIKAIKGERFQIGNNCGFINGWVNFDAIFGRCSEIEN